MEQSVLRRYFPSFYRMAPLWGRGLGRIRRRFSWAWVKLVIALGVCSVWICLWVESHSWHSYAGQEFALGARGAGILVQATSYRPGRLHLLVMRDRSQQSAILSLKRLTYLGNGGYHHSYGFDLLGFAFALLPYDFNEGDSLLSPYGALVVPYWFLTVATALLVLKYAGWLPRLGLRRFAAVERMSRATVRSSRMRLWMLLAVAAITFLALCLRMWPAGDPGRHELTDPRLLRLPDYGITAVTYDGRRQNEEARQRFLLAYRAKSPARWKHIHHTTEGDPIIISLFYEGGNTPVHVVIDTTRDKFGHPSITECRCDDLQQVGSMLKLTGCAGIREGGTVLTLP